MHSAPDAHAEATQAALEKNPDLVNHVTFDGIIRSYMVKIISCALESSKYFMELLYDSSESSKLANELNYLTETDSKLCSRTLADWMIVSSIVGNHSSIDFDKAASHILRNLNKGQFNVSLCLYFEIHFIFQCLDAAMESWKCYV